MNNLCFDTYVYVGVRVYIDYTNTCNKPYYFVFQSNEVGGSTHMEKEGLIRSLSACDSENLKIDVLVTDRHPQVQKHMRTKRTDIHHYYDPWHITKGESVFITSSEISVSVFIQS